MAVHAGMKGWNQLPINVVTKDIPPGWGGPGTEKTFRAWRDDLRSWMKICNYDTNDAAISAVEFRGAEAAEDVEAAALLPPPMSCSVS